MKNKYIIKVLMIACFGMIISCSDFLDEDARGLLTPDTFFQNEEEAILAINKLNEGVGGAGFLWLLGTDVGVSGRSALAFSHRFGAYQYDASNRIVSWSNQYEAIRDANLVLASIERSSLSDEVKGVVRAQTLFFRAFQYLNLATTFGDVPFIVDELIDIEEVSLKGQTDDVVVISAMIDDLEEAISSGFLSTNTWGDNDGRPTVWAARMLKAYCHVWIEEWPEARAELIEITQNSSHQLHDDYADKYREGNEIHSEVIFGKQFLADIFSSDIRVFWPHFGASSPDVRLAFEEVGMGYGSSPNTLRKSFANTYDDADERKIYNVWDEYVFEGTTDTIQFDWTYMPKFMRGPVPVSDPLFEELEDGRNSSAPNRIFLLADAYLLLAEAEFMIGGSTAAALSAINTVRNRANLPDLGVLTIEDIRIERAWELVGEGYWGRKRDLIRWGILDATVLGLPAAEIAAGATTVAIERAQDEADIIANAPAGRFTQYPVPLEEILQSEFIGGNLVQNPLWQ